MAEADGRGMTVITQATRVVGVCPECGGLVALGYGTVWHHLDRTAGGHDVPWPRSALVVLTDAQLVEERR